MSSLRSELHVAQQIRRDKLRIQNSSQHLQDFPNELPSLHHQGLARFNNSDLLQDRNDNNMLDVNDEAAAAAIYSSEMMINFATPSNPLPAPRNNHYCQQLSSSSRQSGSFSHSSSTTNILSSSKDDQCSSLGNWRNSFPHQFSDWMVNNYASSSVPNPNSFLVSEPTNNNNNIIINYAKPSCNLLTDLRSSSPSSSSHQPQIYHNALQDIFKSTTSTIHGSEKDWSSLPVFHGNEQLSFGSSANMWTNTNNMGSLLSDSNPPNQIQGLSLSLSSNISQSKPSASHVEERSTSDIRPHQKPVNVKPIHQESMGRGTTPSSYRNVGPLGPFTGYATILKSSRFLKPCQLLLDECCCCQSGKQIAEWVSRDVSADDAVKGNNSGASSSMFYASKEKSTDDGSSSFCLSSWPECQKNKDKLLYMQEEVTRRYKQYHQQMQLVVSSFESVAGLSCATPYISLALKSVSRHFKCLKNAISDQLRLAYEIMGDDISTPTTCTSSKIDNSIAKLNCMDHSFQKNKSGLEPQQHVWRPQRGLPERAVAILKSWLFEHFLHPYPTDTDKHMLATQTGLSRNQVSNWFINARVRVWKPMVEEIHMLETKTTTEGHNNNSTINERGSTSASEAATHTNAIAERQFECLEMGSSSAASGNEEKRTYEEQWNQEKRSKLECEVAPNMDATATTVMGFMPYRRGSGLEVGGLGSVSLTLGLRHGVEGVQHQQQQQFQQEVELRRQFGGHMIHDFVG